MDEFRDLAEGRLTPEQERRLRERCAKDPELQAELEATLEAHRLTHAADVRPPRCRVSFDEIEGALRARRARTLVICGATTATVLLLALGATALGFFDGSEPVSETPTSIALEAIPLADVVVEESPPEIPSFLAEYRSYDEGRVRWLTNLPNALAAAKISERPILVFLYFPGCPSCDSMEDRTLLDSAVQEEFRSFVPLRVDITSAPVGLDIRKMAKEGIPWFGTLDSAGGEMYAFPGVSEAGAFVESLRSARDLVRAPSLSWGRLNTLVARLLAARQNEQAEEWLCDADAEYRALSMECPAGPLRDAAVQGRLRLERRAHQAFVGAKILADKGERAAAMAALDREIELFDDTPYAADFRAAQTYLRQHGRFPDLTIASR